MDISSYRILLRSDLFFELCSLSNLREQVKTEDKDVKKKSYEAGPKASFGYGGQFGVEKDKMDKVFSSNLLYFWIYKASIFLFTLEYVLKFGVKFQFSFTFGSLRVRIWM